MLSRTLLLTLGIGALLAGILLAVLWLYQSASPPPAQTKLIPKQSILLAAHEIAAGTLLRPSDVILGDVPTSEIVGIAIVSGSGAATDVSGAVTRRAFAAREPLTTAALVRPGDREFLVAALAPGYRAVSIAVDAAQSTSGLVFPGDRVDIVLTQNFSAEGIEAGHKSVGETVLYDLRVIAVDQASSTVAPPLVPGNALSEPRMPKTVTLEVTERQGAMLLVAEQLGKVQLALRGRQGREGAPQGAEEQVPPTWASDVSRALTEPEPAAGPEAPKANHAVIEVMRGSKIEHRCQTSAGLVACP